MAIKVILLEKKLCRYVNQLCKETEEAKVRLIREDLDQLNTIRDLKESSMLLDKMIIRIREIQTEIEQLPDHILDKTKELLKVVDLSLAAELAAETIRCKVDTKLLYFDKVRDGSSLLHNISEPDAKIVPKSTSSDVEVIKNRTSLTLEFPESDATSLTVEVSESDTKVDPNNTSSDFEEIENESSLSERIMGYRDEEAPIDVPDTRSSSNEEVSSIVGNEVSLTSSITKSVELEADSRKTFTLKRSTGLPDYDYSRFLEDFLVSVNESPLEEKYKFAALRGLVRGCPYRLFLDLDYRHEGEYQKALQRFLDEFANDALKQETKERITRSWIPPSIENSSPSNRWSDEYFAEKYCKAAPNYEKPSRELLTRAIHAFLNLYVFGPRQVESKNWHLVWMILLHGVKLGDRYLLDRSNSQIFGKEKIPFPDIKESSKISLEKYAPCLRAEKTNERPTSKIWQWKYTTMEDGKITEDVITSSVVKSWYENCWETVKSANEDTFDDFVRYFALLSMILFRDTIKRPDNLENHVMFAFNKTFRSFCSSPILPNAVPPHAAVHALIRRKIFRRSSRNFKRYLTYLVGAYAFSDAVIRGKTRQFLNAGCLLQFSSAAIGNIYWLRKAAEIKKMRPLDLLMFFLIDPSMETQVKNLYVFIETYRKEITWWWCRFFENKKLQEVSTANNPAFSYACFIITAASEKEITRSKQFEQFSRIKDQPSDLNGETLGRALKFIIDEWNSIPLTQNTRYLFKNEEIQKCFVKSNSKGKRKPRPE